jgi:hypothetical protein
MSDDNTQDGAEPSPASAGSHGPVAWPVMLSSGCMYGLHEEQWEATAICEALKTHDIANALIVPLYRQPQQSAIDQLKEAIRRLADQDATLSVCDGNVTVTMDATLTDAEREAISTAAWNLESMPGGDLAGRVTTTLLALLKRTRVK